MTRRKLEGLKREVAQARRSPQKAGALQSLARRLGRVLVNRGKHPMWENEEFPNLYALSIPDHSGRDIPVGTKNSILNSLEDDIAAWEISLSDEGDEENGEGQEVGGGE